MLSALSRLEILMIDSSGMQVARVSCSFDFSTSDTRMKSLPSFVRNLRSYASPRNVPAELA